MIELSQNGDFISIKDWIPEPTGEWSKDCRIGREHATLVLAAMRRFDSPTLLSLKAEQIAAPAFEGIRCGFYQAIAERALEHKEPAVFRNTREDYEVALANSVPHRPRNRNNTPLAPIDY
jgi:hypothetical protein